MSSSDNINVRQVSEGSEEEDASASASANAEGAEGGASSVVGEGGASSVVGEGASSVDVEAPLPPPLPSSSNGSAREGAFSGLEGGAEVTPPPAINAVDVEGGEANVAADTQGGADFLPPLKDGARTITWTREAATPTDGNGNGNGTPTSPLGSSLSPMYDEVTGGESSLPAIHSIASATKHTQNWSRANSSNKKQGLTNAVKKHQIAEQWNLWRTAGWGKGKVGPSSGEASFEGTPTSPGQTMHHLNEVVAAEVSENSRYQRFNETKDLMTQLVEQHGKTISNEGEQFDVIDTLIRALDPRQGLHALDTLSKSESESTQYSTLNRVMDFFGGFFSGVGVEADPTPTAVFKSAFLYCVLFGYLSLGARVLSNLEEGPEKDRIAKYRTDYAEHETNVYNACYGPSATNATHEPCHAAIQELAAFSAGNSVYRAQVEKLDAGEPYVHRFDYWHCFYIVFQTITTIGYGDIVPFTEDGRLFLVLFSLIGLGLHGMILIRDAVVFNRASGFLNELMDLPFFSEQYENVILISFFAALYIVVYSQIMEHLVGWSLSDCYYYAWISFTTIGYGDFSLTSGDTPGMPAKDFPWYVITWMLLTAMGLSLLAALLTSMLEASSVSLKDVLEVVMEHALEAVTNQEAREERAREELDALLNGAAERAEWCDDRWTK
ncbi:potassium channel [Pycnococcus provasolii]